MSVINKVLRDLDDRRAQQTAAEPGTGMGGLLRGTALVTPGSQSPTRGKTPWPWLGAALALSAALVLVYVLHGPTATQPALGREQGGTHVDDAPTGTGTGTGTGVLPASANPQAAATPPANVGAPPAPPTRAGVTTVSQPAPVARAVSASTTPEAPKRNAQATTAPSPDVSAPGLRLERSLDVGRAPRTSTTSPAVPIASVPKSVTSTPQAPNAAPASAAAPGTEALAQAQTLWNSGAHDAAMGLLQDALGVLERAAAHGGAKEAKALPTLLRELTRMQLAEGRLAAVWDNLTRLEPLVGDATDLWAIRANAAQRLGHHQDSVRAYTRALQAKPNEQRWVLGAAVSLAALGELPAATDMLQRARSLGEVSKDVLAYLRQMGVVER